MSKSVPAAALTDVDMYRHAIWSYRGALELLEGGCVSLLGCGRPDEEAVRRSRRLAREVTEIGWGVAARLAPGVPLEAMQAAHEARGWVIGVMRAGFDVFGSHELHDFGKLLAREHLLLSEVCGPSSRRSHTSNIACMMAAITEASILVTNSGLAHTQYQACLSWGRPFFVLASAARRPPDWLDLERPGVSVISDFDDLLGALCSLPRPKHGW